MTEIDPAYVQRLEAENASLRRALFGAQALVLPPGVSLTAKVRLTLAAIAQGNGEVVPQDRVYSAVYSENPDEAPTVATVRVMVCKLRRELAGFVEIETQVGYGYSIKAETCAKLRGEVPWQRKSPGPRPPRPRSKPPKAQ